jgi:CBS domain containing-hemolysin-like protein
MPGRCGRTRAGRGGDDGVIEILLLLLAVSLTLACGGFVAAEFSLTTVEPSELDHAAAAGERGADSALRAVRRLTFELSGAQLGITVTTLLVGMLAEPSLSRLLDGPLGALGLSDRATSSVAVVLGVGLSTGVVMVIGELVPKNWAIARPLAVARRVAAPLRAFTAALGPFIRHLNNMANRVVRRVGLEPTEALAAARTPDELVALARHSATEGLLEPDSAELFGRILHLGDLTAEHVMTPRVDVHALDRTAGAVDVVDLTVATGLSRFPVYRGSLDDVVGVVHITDVIAIEEAARRGTPVADLATEPLLVPSSLPVDQLLDRLRGAHGMAVVIDEYGGTAGVATREDIVEEVVGDVRDEHDPDTHPELAEIADGVWEAAGNVRLDQLAAIGLVAPDGPYDTVAGLVATILGRIPTTDDAIDVNGWQVTVLDVDHHHADRVRLTRAAPSSPDEPPDTPS